MDIRPVQTEGDYDWALAEVQQYFNCEPALGSAEADRFAVLSTLIGAYEDRHWPIAALDPIDAIREVMREKSLKAADLGRLIGSRSRASELLGRKRPLTMEQAGKLHQEWHIRAEILLRQGAPQQPIDPDAPPPPRISDAAAASR